MAPHQPWYRSASFLLNKTHIDQMTVRNEVVIDNMGEKNNDCVISRVFIEWQRTSPKSRRTTLRTPLVRNFLAEIVWWAALRITRRLGCAFYSSRISHCYVERKYRVPLSNEVSWASTNSYPTWIISTDRIEEVLSEKGQRICGWALLVFMSRRISFSCG